MKIICLTILMSVMWRQCTGSFLLIYCLSAKYFISGRAMPLVDSRSGDTPHHDWNRPAGRPRTTWMSQVMRDTGLTAADAWAIADDRSTWRALRPIAGYTQQWVSECHSLCQVLQRSSDCLQVPWHKFWLHEDVVGAYGGWYAQQTVVNELCV